MDVASQKRFLCNLCSYGSGKKSSLKQHLYAVHLGLRPYKCDKCNYACAESTKFKRHVDSVHLGLRPYKCDKCNYSSAERTKLKLHVDGVHLGLKPYKCDKCNYASAESRTLKRHVWIKHSSGNESRMILKCDSCNFKATRYVQISLPTKAVHLGLKPYKCDECQFQAGFPASLQYHRKKYHLSSLNNHKRRKNKKTVPITSLGNRLMCNDCGFQSLSRELMREHVLREHRTRRRYKGKSWKKDTISNSNPKLRTTPRREPIVKLERLSLEVAMEWLPLKDVMCFFGKNGIKSKRYRSRNKFAKGDNTSSTIQPPMINPKPIRLVTSLVDSVTLPKSQLSLSNGDDMPGNQVAKSNTKEVDDDIEIIEVSDEDSGINTMNETIESVTIEVECQICGYGAASDDALTCHIMEQHVIC